MLLWMWGGYLCIFLVFSFFEGIGQGVFFLGTADDANSVITFNVDQLESGAGFENLLRGAFSAGRFVLSLLPKLITWNFGLLTGPIGEPIRFILIFIGGGMLMMTLTMAALNLRQRLG